MHVRILAGLLGALAAPITAQATYSFGSMGGAGGTELGLADLDSDGDVEVVVVGGWKIKALANTGGGQFPSILYGASVLGGSLDALGAAGTVACYGVTLTQPGVHRVVALRKAPWQVSTLLNPSRPVTAVAVGNGGLPRPDVATAVEGTPLSPGGIAYHNAGGQTGGFGGLSGFSRHPVDLRWSDVNNDGRPDIVAVAKAELGGATDEIQVFVANVLNHFSAVAAVIPAIHRGTSESMWCGDLDGDGADDDVVITHPSLFPTPTNELFIALNVLGTPTTFTVPVPGSFAVDVEIADIQGNGLLDAIVVNSVSDDVFVLYDLDVGAQSFASTGAIAHGANPVAVAVGDLNGDPFPDVVVLNNGSNDVTVSLGGPSALVADLGGGCAGTNGVPSIFPGLGSPVLGNSLFLIGVTSARANSAAVLLLGTTQANVALGPCTLRVASSVHAVEITTNAGGATVGMPIPSNAFQLLGFEFYGQWAILDPQGAFQNAIAMSDALKVRIGVN